MHRIKRKSKFYTIISINFIPFLFRRPTSVFKRVQGEPKDTREMKNVFNYSNYGDIDTLDYPHLAPGMMSIICAFN